MKTMKYLFMLTVMALMAACMEDEVYEGPSSIDSVASSVAAPTSTDNVTVTAVVSGLQAVRILRDGGQRGWLLY